MQLYDGRTEFYQYDTNQKLICDCCKANDEVHFSNRHYLYDAVCLTYELDGQIVVNVPNAYLLTSGELIVYRTYVDDDGRSTLKRYTFNVLPRKKPSDYVYEETEVLSYKRYESLTQELIEQLDMAHEEMRITQESAERSVEQSAAFASEAEKFKEDAAESADIAIKAAASEVLEHAGTIVCSAEGERIELDDASNRPFLGMRVYGKSYNVDLGLVNTTVNVTGDGTVQELVCGSPILFGIPVDSGGNYTDENGQQWIADYKDYTRGVNVQKVGHIKRYADETINGAWMSSTGELSPGAHVLYALETPVETPMWHVYTANFEYGVGRFSQCFAEGDVAFRGKHSLMYKAYPGSLMGGRDVQMQHFFDNNGNSQLLTSGKYTVTFWAADPNNMVGNANGNSKIIMTFHTADQGYLFDQNKYYGDCGHYYDPEQCAAYKELVDITGGKYLVEATGKEETANGVTWKQYKFDIALDREIAAVNFYLLQPNACDNYANKEFYLDCFEICDISELDAYRALHTNKLNTTIYTDKGAHIEVEYAADTKAYVDKKLAELAAVIIKE